MRSCSSSSFFSKFRFRSPWEYYYIHSINDLHITWRQNPSRSKFIHDSLSSPSKLSNTCEETMNTRNTTVAWCCVKVQRLKATFWGSPTCREEA